MKIFFTIDTLQTGGAEKSMLDILSRFSGDITPVMISFYEGNFLQPQFEQAGIRVITFNLRGKYDLIKGIKLFKRLCIDEKPDLVVATLFRSEVISRIVCKQLNIKVIGTFVNDTYSRFEMDRLSRMQRLKIVVFKLVNQWTAKYCFKFLANSNAIKQSNSEALKVPLQKIEVIYRGRDVNKLNGSKVSRLQGDGIKILNVGRLLPRKGQAELIRAFALFIEYYPQATLTIAGEGKYRETLIHLIQELGLEGKVYLKGNVQDVPTLLHEHDLFIFPSWYEGFSGALVEAILAGLPVIASDIEMNKEAVEHNKTGLLFKVRNVNELLDVMLFAMKNKGLMLEMAEAARQAAKEKYDIRNIARQHERFYQACLV